MYYIFLQVQYVFLHDALHEILNVGFTTVSVQKLNTLHENQDIMKKQYEVKKALYFIIPCVDAVITS